jgi:hypothetical protein
MATVPTSTRGKRLFIFRSPAAQAPPAPVRVNPSPHLADAQVLSTPPESVQLVEPELIISTQLSVCDFVGEQMTRSPIRASAHAGRTHPAGVLKSLIICKVSYLIWGVSQMDLFRRNSLAVPESNVTAKSERRIKTPPLQGLRGGSKLRQLGDQHPVARTLC